MYDFYVHLSKNKVVPGNTFRNNAGRTAEALNATLLAGAELTVEGLSGQVENSRLGEFSKNQKS